MREGSQGSVFGVRKFPLWPLNGTRLAETHKGHYAPMDHMQKDWELGILWPSDKMSYWGNQFKNGDLLDCISFCEMVSFVMDDHNAEALLEHGYSWLG